jgi:hypothetical protein
MPSAALVTERAAEPGAPAPLPPPAARRALRAFSSSAIALTKPSASALLIGEMEETLWRSVTP